MLRALLVVFAMALSGCAVTPSCYIGISLLPLGPFVHCGVEPALKPTEEKDDLDV